MAEESLIQTLVDNYVYQKEELIKEAGGKGRLDRDRLSSMIRPRMEKMAEVVKDWDVRPDILMTAAFAWARKNRHPDGPMPNMLCSVKYLTNALSNYLQVPYEVVMEKRSMDLFLERMDFEFERFRNELEKAGVTDMVSATSYPVEARYLISVHDLDWEAMFYMAQELLERMAGDKRVEMWLNHRGIEYRSVAAHFNKRKKNL